jgi:hypothetical protein
VVLSAALVLLGVTTYYHGALCVPRRSPLGLMALVAGVPLAMASLAMAGLSVW